MFSRIPFILKSVLEEKCTKTVEFSSLFSSKDWRFLCLRRCPTRCYMCVCSNGKQPRHNTALCCWLQPDGLMAQSNNQSPDIRFTSICFVEDELQPPLYVTVTGQYGCLTSPLPVLRWNHFVEKDLAHWSSKHKSIFADGSFGSFVSCRPYLCATLSSGLEDELVN